MKLSTLLVGLALTFNVACADSISAALDIHAAQGPSGLTKWSTVGVIADSSTDNNVALNALGIGPYEADCPAGGTIRFSGQWLLKSNQAIYGIDHSCFVQGTSSIGASVGFITQADLTTPLSNVTLNGLGFKLLSSTQTGRAFHLYANNLTLKSIRVDLNNGAFHLRGSCQELSYSSVVNSATTSGSGHVGVRYYGNDPKVACVQVDSLGAAVDVWNHHNTFISGDGTYQVSLTDQGIWANVSADNYTFENNVGASTAAPVVLIGQSDRVGSTFTASITNVVVRSTTGSCGKQCVLIQSNDNPTGLISNVSVSSSTFDASPSTSPTPAINVLGDDVSLVTNVTVDGVTIINPYQLGARFDTGVTNSTLKNSTIGSQRQGTGYNVQVRAASGITIQSNLIGAIAGGVQLGPSTFLAVAPIVTGNTISGVVNNKAGILAQNVSGGTITSNTVSPAAGTTHAIGAQLSAGTVNTVLTGNDFSAMTNNPTVIFACGQGNTASGNIGAGSNYSC